MIGLLDEGQLRGTQFNSLTLLRLGRKQHSDQGKYQVCHRRALAWLANVQSCSALCLVHQQWSVSHVASAASKSSEPIVQHLAPAPAPAPATSNYQGRQEAVRWATEPLTQLRNSATAQRTPPAPFPVSASGIRALYRVACSKRGPRFLNSTGKSASLCLGNLGGVGGAARTV
jgi:hypothetical protein